MGDQPVLDRSIFRTCRRYTSSPSQGQAAFGRRAAMNADTHRTVYVLHKQCDVCHIWCMDQKRVVFRKSTRKHRVGHTHALYVMNSYRPDYETRGRFYWLAEDSTGRLLEVIAIDEPDQIAVIHVMPHALRGYRNA